MDRIRDWLERFICPMDPRDLDLLTLWAAHTHLVNETYTSPRLLIESPVPESGKRPYLNTWNGFAYSPYRWRPSRHPR